MIVIRDVTQLILPSLQMMFIQIFRKFGNKIILIFDGKFAFLQQNLLESRSIVFGFDIHEARLRCKCFEFFEVVKEVMSSRNIIKEFGFEFSITLAISSYYNFATGFKDLLKMYDDNERNIKGFEYIDSLLYRKLRLDSEVNKKVGFGIST